MPEPRLISITGVGLANCAADIVEIAAFRNRAPELERLVASHGMELPAPGRMTVAEDHLALCVRPDRWLVLAAPASPGETARRGQETCAPLGAVIDHSSGLDALCLVGQAAREVLKRGCRLDLDPTVFPAGAAAATIIAQVPAILAALPWGVLLLTPATTARHLREWLAATAAPFGLEPRADVTVGPGLVSGDPLA